MKDKTKEVLENVAIVAGTAGIVACVILCYNAGYRDGRNSENATNRINGILEAVSKFKGEKVEAHGLTEAVEEGYLLEAIKNYLDVYGEPDYMVECGFEPNGEGYKLIR